MQDRAAGRGGLVTDSPADRLAGTVNRAAGQSDDLVEALGIAIGSELLERALMHRSFAYENGGLPTNERLEFLGDSVLGLIVTDTLFRSYPDLPEGQLAKLRAAVVNMRALAGVARGLDLGSYVRLGKGEEGTGGRDKSSILADTLEAVIGAVYLDKGLVAADALVHRLFDPVIARSARLGAGLDWKTSLQELTAAEILGVPEYHVEESGPDHQKSFRAFVRIGSQTYGEGEGRSKKEAEQQAAEAAWNAITEGIAGGAEG
jgi:ribonuclease-3